MKLENEQVKYIKLINTWVMVEASAMLMRCE